MAPFLALTLQRPRDHHEGGMETTLLWAAFSLGAWPWPEGGSGDTGKEGKETGPLGEEVSLGRGAPPSLAKMG